MLGNLPQVVAVLCGNLPPDTPNLVDFVITHRYRRRPSWCLRNLHRRVDLALLGQPGDVSSLGMLLDLLKKLNRFRFVARLAWVINGDDHFNLDRNDIFLTLNQSSPLDSLSSNTHG